LNLYSSYSVKIITENALVNYGELWLRLSRHSQAGAAEGAMLWTWWSEDVARGTKPDTRLVFFNRHSNGKNIHKNKYITWGTKRNPMAYKYPLNISPFPIHTYNFRLSCLNMPLLLINPKYSIFIDTYSNIFKLYIFQKTSEISASVWWWSRWSSLATRHDCFTVCLHDLHEWVINVGWMLVNIPYMERFCALSLWEVGTMSWSRKEGHETPTVAIPYGPHFGPKSSSSTGNFAK
jgi:hypothetical protein